MKRVLIPIITLVICMTVIWRWTYGFNAFTIFSYTLKKAGEIPRTFPDIRLESQDGSVFYLKDKNKYVLINFVYLNCPNVCHKVNNQLENIYHQMDTTIVPSQLEFVTVSFDLKNDNIKKIKKYRSYFGDDIGGWTFALPYQTDENEFLSFLQKAGIYAQEVRSNGIINHSIYLFLISPDNKIVKVFDPARESNTQIIEQLYQCLKEKQRT